MSKEEQLGRGLIALYGLCVMPWVFHHGRVISWKVYVKELGPAIFFYEFDNWKTLLFGELSIRDSVMFKSVESICRKASLNEFVFDLNSAFKEIYHAEVIDFKTLDELDILLTLAGKNTGSEL